jgi:O-antigen/teichoic acid export membrane protein
MSVKKEEMKSEGTGSSMRKNSLWGIAEVLGSGLTLFFLYRVVVGSLGIKALGIWSLVLVTTSLGRLADIGTAAGLGKFVAAANAKNDREKLIQYAETAVITNFALYAVIALAMWAPAYYALSFAMSGDDLVQARALLPYSLISFILMSLTTATTGAVMGQHRADQKSMASLAGCVVQFAVAVLLVPRYGLPALAWAQISQFTLIIVAGWLLFLKNHYGRWTFRLPLRWSRGVLKELLTFGVKLQAVTVASMFYDPLIKFTMSKFGGLAALGYFEMAQRLILQVRQLVVMPSQPLIPSFAHLLETSPEQIGALYRKALSLTIVAGFPMLAGVAITSPVISWLWIGQVEPDFVMFLIIMSIGWFVNVVGGPAYFMGIGTGRVKGNFYGQVLTTGGGFFATYILGYFGKAYGVAVASTLMLSLGALLTMRMNCREINIGMMPGMKDFAALWASVKNPRLLFGPTGGR